MSSADPSAMVFTLYDEDVIYAFVSAAAAAAYFCEPDAFGDLRVWDSEGRALGAAWDADSGWYRFVPTGPAEPEALLDLLESGLPIAPGEVSKGTLGFAAETDLTAAVESVKKGLRRR